MQPFAMGALPSPFDHRDWPVAAFIPAEVAAFPAQWDFTGLLQPVLNQGSEGSCVGHALVGVMGYQQETYPLGMPDHEHLSRRDAYQGARSVEPVPSGIDGAYPRAAMKYAAKSGICLEATWPYMAKIAGRPGPTVEAERARNRIASYSAVPADVSAMKEALTYHGPMLVAGNIDAGFQTPGPSGVIVSRGPTLGGHAFVIAGWDDKRGAWRIRNSWGTSWGDGGDAWLPYSWPLYDRWVCTPAAGTPPPELPWWARLFPWWMP